MQSVARKEQAYLRRIQELENQLKNSDSGEIETIRESAQRTERELRSKIEDLTNQLSRNPVRADDWAVAEEVEKTLRISLEAIQITQDELNRKAGR